MRNLLSQLLAVGPELAAFILTSPLLGSRGAYAITQTVVASPDLDLSQLGQVAVAGDFDSISLYTYAGQSENVFTTNGSQSILTRYPNGAFESVSEADAYIEAMCPFIQDGVLQGMVVGGNFTSLGGVEAQSVALWNSNTSTIEALSGISGVVNALYCDSESGTVFFGGMFTAGTSTNAIAWITGWTNLPFAGFNGPVNSIIKNAAGNIVFGGDFDGLGNATTPTEASAQVVNLSGGTISANGTTTTAGFDNPSNIICQTGEDGPDNAWLLADGTQGYWEGNYSYGFIPTKMRLYNTKYQGRGTKTFYFQNLNSGGIPNLNYIDSNGQNQSCSSVCTLPQDNTTYQDYYFVPPVGMDSFRVQITEWYGDGGGLAGIEMFQNDLYSFAVNDFNEPKCDSVSQGSSSTISPANGTWEQITNNGTTSSDYLSAYLTDASQLAPSTSVIFNPNIRQSGNYSVMVYTPGCVADGSCGTRGTVNMTGTMTSNNAPITTTIYQTNDYDKFDQVYFGYVDVDTDVFKPSVTLSPMPNQPLPLTVVAQRVRFEVVTTTGGLNGLFEYDPNEAAVNTDFSSSAINAAGSSLSSGAIINAVANYMNEIYVGGNFSGTGISNVMSVGTNASALPNQGLNASVNTLFVSGSTMYLGGNFTSTADGSVQGLSNVAAFDLDNSKWIPLGAGVNGPVYNLVPLTINVTANDEEDCITVNGEFTSVNAFGGNDAFDAIGMAVWVPSQNNWLENIPNTNVAISGKLFTSTNLPTNPQNVTMMYAGQISSQALGLSGAVGLVGSGTPIVQSLGIQLHTTNTTPSSMSKRATDTSQNFTGVYTGLYYDDNGSNITVLGGHFSATASDGSTVDNLIFLSTKNSKHTVTGASELDSDSTIAAMDTQGSLLFAGGSLTGRVGSNDLNGLIVYDLSKMEIASPHPPALSGDNVVVNAVAAQPSSSSIFVGGNFKDAGSLPCASLCYYDTSTQQWNTPGIGLSGTISSMFWSSNTELIIAGDLTVSDNKTTMVTYDSKKQTFTQYTAASTLPGPIMALSPAYDKYDHFWAAGMATSNNSAFLAYYSDSTWTGVGGLGPGTIIRGVQPLAVTSNHDSTVLVPQNEVLLLTGNINIGSFGNASAVLFNGTTFEPFLLTNKEDGTQGSLSSIFVSNPQNLMKPGHSHLAIGFIVLIGLAIALALIFLIVVAGIFIERSRRRKEGYVPMSTDRNGNLARIPPEALLGGLKEKEETPRI